MKASEHTDVMLAWWKQRGISRVDLAIRRSDGVVCWQRDRPLESLPLAWARAENVRRAEIYARPARLYAWPVIFLDDVDPVCAAQLASGQDALVVRTSRAGGCHLWVARGRPLAEAERAAVQPGPVANARFARATGAPANEVGADVRSSSGEHLGRLAGFRNWKRGGEWVNVLYAAGQRLPWEGSSPSRQQLACRISPSTPTSPGPRRRPTDAGACRDSSESGREWGWVCGMLEAGATPQWVTDRLVERASPRRGRDTRRYAERTVTRALRRFS